MKYTLNILIVLSFLVTAFAACASSVPAQMSVDEWVTNVYYPSTGLLYEQNETGNMQFVCTATAFEKRQGDAIRGDIYRFVTASHCVTQSNANEEKKTFFYITRDGQDEKHFMKAHVVGFGDKSVGDDFSVLEVHTHDNFSVLPIGNDPTAIAGEPVMNISSPMGLGKQVFEGRVSSPHLNRPVEIGSISWTDAIMLQMFGVNGGASGSTVVCERQRAVCAFIVGTAGDTNVIALRVSRFKKFYAALSNDDYNAPKKNEALK